MIKVDRTTRIELLIERYQHLLRLGDWDIRLAKEADLEAEEWAAVQHLPTVRIAAIHVKDTVPDDYVESVVIHELMHLVLSPVWTMLGHLGAKSGKGGLAIIDQMEAEFEFICDRVSHAFTGITFRADPDHEPTVKSLAPFCAPRIDGDVPST
jgi:hypothetical protein